MFFKVKHYQKRTKYYLSDQAKDFLKFVLAFVVLVVLFGIAGNLELQALEQAGAIITK